MQRFSSQTVALALLATFVLHANAHATTFVVLSDEDLIRGASVIALGTVDGIATTADARAGLSTMVRISVEEQLKGPPTDHVIVAIPGGTASQVSRVVYGAPQFYRGERVLVFLRQRPDGFFSTVGWAMGKYTVVPTASGLEARRQLAGPGAAVLSYDSGTGTLRSGEATRRRSLAALLATVRRLVAAAPPSQMPLVYGPEEPDSRFVDAFTFLGAPPARWIEPDQGLPVTYRVVPTGDAALGAAASRGAVHAAMAAWNAAGSSLQLLDGGDATPAPFSRCDGKNTIEFDDPFGEIGPPINCTGVLAVGGFCTDASETSTVHGTTFLRITEGDVTVNGGFAHCPYWTATNLAEVLTHELGHTVGLGHSSENPDEPNPVLRNATMYYLAHFDGRGATVESDDIAGIQALYPPGSTPLVLVPTLLPLTLQTFTLDSMKATAIISGLLQFPAKTGAPVEHMGFTISLSDSLGTLYNGTVQARTLQPVRVRILPRSAVSQSRYVGTVASSAGRGGVVVLTLLGDGAVGVELRLSSASLVRASGQGTVLSLTFGDVIFSATPTLQLGTDRIWVLGRSSDAARPTERAAARQGSTGGKPAVQP
jgi:Matrixin